MRRIVIVGICLAFTATLLPAHAAAPLSQSSEAPFDPTSEVTIDSRASALVEPAASAVRAAAGLAREVSDVHVTWNARMGTAKNVFSESGFLSGASKVAPLTIARTWIGSHRALLGLSAAAVRDLTVTRDAAMPQSGLRPFVFRVMYGKIATFAGGTIGVNVMPDGRILSAWADTGPTGTLQSTPKLSAADALRALTRRLGVKMTVTLRAASTRADRLTIFEPGGLVNRHNVRLVAFPTAAGPVLTWRVFLSKTTDEMLSSAVDASTGRVMYVFNHVDDFEGKVYENYPGAPKGGKQRVVSFDGDPKYSPAGWVGLPVQGAKTAQQIPTTLGNNALASTDWGEFKLAPAGVALALAQLNPIPDYMPVAPDGKFNYDFHNNWGRYCQPVGVAPVTVGVDAAGQSRSQTLPSRFVENPSYISDRDASVTNIFYFVNKIHDLSYKYGFTEKMGNFQWDNFGKGAKGMDPVHYQAMAGVLNGSLDNANMFTPPDGGEPADLVAGAVNPDAPASNSITNYIPPFGNMYLWRSVPGFAAPCADGDQDASIAWHEYTHGISNRMVGGPDDASALGAQQSGSMGEAWSDWNAMNFLFMLGLETRAVEGIYATGNAITGIRHYPLDKNPLTYGDFGFGTRGPEVHDDGEIWSATLWQLRAALIAKYGNKVGIERVTNLVYHAFAVSPRLPTFLDQRDAILKSDLALYKGTDTALIWQVFASRGMGRSASSKDANDIHPHPAFDVPGTNNGTLSGTIYDADGGVLRGRVYIGVAQGQPSPVAVGATSGVYSAKLQPGTYNVTAGGPGYGLQPLGKIVIDAGETIKRDIVLYKNVASVGYGARVIDGVGGGDTGIALIDDHESSGQLVTVGVPLVVKLGGNGAVVQDLAVTPSGRGTAGPATVYRVELSTDAVHWRAVKRGGVNDAVLPRPRLTEFGRSFTDLSAPMKAKFARITVTDTQFGRPATGAWTAVLRDLSVYGASSGARVFAAGAEKPFKEDGTIAVANAGGGSGGADASLTENVWLATCSKPPAPIQGLDAYIFELPDSAGDGVHVFNEINKSGTATDIDIYFWNRDCTVELGRAASSAASEAGPLPPGTKWVLAVLFAGTTDGFSGIAKTTLESVIPPKGTARPPKR